MFVFKIQNYLENWPTSTSKIGLFKLASNNKSAEEDEEEFKWFLLLLLPAPLSFTSPRMAGLNIRTIPVNDPVIIRLELVPVKCLNEWIARLLEEYSSSGPAPES